MADRFASFEVTDEDLEFEKHNGFYGGGGKQKKKMTKEQAMLGIFGDDSDDDGNDYKKKKSYDNFQSFVKSESIQEDESGEDEDEDKMEDGEDDEDNMDWKRTGFREKSEEYDKPPSFNTTSKKPKEKAKIEIKKKTQNQKQKQNPNKRVKTEQPSLERYGIGMKLLKGMGFKEGEGLGKNKQGMTEPIQVKLRPGKYGINYEGFQEKTDQVKALEVTDSSEEEILEIEENIQMWKSQVAGEKKSKKKKVVYKTVDELISENNDIQSKIIDMTGPQEQVLSSTQVSQKIIYRSESHFPELRHNLRLLVDITGNEIKTIDTNMRREKAIQDKIREEIDEYNRFRQIDEMKITKLEQIFSQVQECRINMKKVTGPINDHSFSEIFVFQQLKELYPDEYKEYNLSSIGVALIVPLIKSLFADWNPLENPVYQISLIRRLRNCLMSEENEVEDETMTPFDSMLYHIWLPKVRSSLNNEWSPRNPDPAIQLFSGWEKIIPKWMHDNITTQLILPKINSEIDLWNPQRDVQPIHLWIHPWLPYLHSSLQEMFRIIRYKLTIVLEKWHPSDESAYLILLPWKNVFDKKDMHDLLKKSIIPKLTLIFNQFVINPANQELRPLSWIMVWGNLMSASTFINLWVNEFFPKWLKILVAWLQNSPNYEEITQWYLGWKQFFPPEMQSHPLIQQQFTKALDLMNHLAVGTSKVKAETVAKFQNTEKKKLEQQKALEPRRKVQLSLKEQLEELASENNLLFLPTKKDQEGKPIYSFGPRHIYFDKENVFLQFNTTWNLVSLDDLLLFALSK